MAKKHIAKKAKWSNKQIFLRIILPILIVALLTSLGFLLLKLLDNHQGYIPPEDILHPHFFPEIILCSSEPRFFPKMDCLFSLAFAPLFS